jgi:HK97 family phage portal protein
MRLLTVRGDEHVISNLFTESSRVPSWTEASGFDTWSGVSVNRTSLGGLPAAVSAIRLIAETIGMVPLLVYDGDPLERERARKSWQWELLHDQPNPEQSPFDFKQDIGTSIETSGDAFVWKMKVRAGRVEAIYVLDPSMVAVKRNKANRKVFEVTIDGNTRTYGPQSILHIRGWTINPGADRGVSPIAYHRHSLGAALGLAEFGGRFWQNNAAPGGVVEIEDDYDAEAEQALRRTWDEQHAGLANAHRPALMFNGAKWKPIGISLEDAQFIASRNYSTEEICRIFRISSPTMLGSVGGGLVNQSATEDFERFLKVDLAPRLVRIEQAFRADRDLFGGSDDMFPEFLADAVMRPDVKTRYEAYRLARQGGWLAPNEIRDRENLPPKDGGDDIQITPVGGAPNAGSAGSSGEAAESEAD